MRRRSFHLPESPGKINVTPLIDVVMCLIVFFLIVGKLAHDQRVRIDLPPSKTGIEEKSPDVLIINVLPAAAAGTHRVVIDAAEIPQAELEAAIRDKLVSRPEAVVEVRGSRQLAYGSVAGVIRACKNAGVASVRLATERAGGGL
jgi:biopolymer transport protein TolR